jgi:sulfite reductase (ferredoxin)
VTEGRTRFGANVGALPARNAPAFIRELLAAWQASGDASDFHRFIDHDGKELARDLIARGQQAPFCKEDGHFFFDWDANSAFSLAGRGAGECSAGVFDLIEVDLANARESLEAGRLYAASFSACHALLVTRSLQPKLERETYELFLRHFVSEGLVDNALATVVAEGMRSASEPNPVGTFAGSPSSVTMLVANVRVLYESMDASLRFKPVAE